jgi:hypothetical protein
MSELLPIPSKHIFPPNPTLPLNLSTPNVIVMLLPGCIVQQDPKIRHLHYINYGFRKRSFVNGGQMKGAAT